MKHSVCAIIPAFNEEQTIIDVIEIAQSSQLIDEIIVISDGSTDKTVERARATGVLVCERKRQHGKGQALLHALPKTNAEVLLFLDADLIGLTRDHLERLLLPAASGARAMNVGLRDRGAFITKIIHKLPLISGERALKREVIEQIPPEFLQGFMVETALNYHCRMHGLAYGAVVLSGLSIRTKYEKVGYLKGVIQYTQMTFEIIQAHLAIRIAKMLGKF